MADNASHALAFSDTVKSTFNDEEEVVVIRNGWTPWKRRRRRRSNVNIKAAIVLLLDIRSVVFVCAVY